MNFIRYHFELRWETSSFNLSFLFVYSFIFLFLFSFEHMHKSKTLVKTHKCFIITFSFFFLSVVLEHKISEVYFFHIFFLLYPHFNTPIYFYFSHTLSLSNKFNMLFFSCNKQLLVTVLMSLAQLIWIIHNICKVQGSNLGHHKQRKNNNC